MPTLFYIFFYLWIINIAAFALYGFDKHRAYYAKSRIPEAVLIFIAFIGGAFGALMGMLFFRHKTRKSRFRVWVPVALIILCVVALFLAYPGTSDSFYMNHFPKLDF